MSNQLITYSEEGFSLSGQSYTVSWLTEQYITLNKTTAELGRQLGISSSSVSNIVKHFGIIKNPHRIQYKEDSFIIDNKEYELDWFIKSYRDPKYSNIDIAVDLNVAPQDIYDIVNHYKISHNVHLFFGEESIVYEQKEISLEQIEKVYLRENRNIKEAAQELQISQNSLEQIIKHYKLNKTNAQKEELRRRTNLEKYGKEYLLQVPEIKERRAKGCQERWGDPNPLASEKWKEKRAKEGKAYYPTQDKVSHFEEWQDVDKFISLLKSKKETAFYWGVYFNVDPSVVHKKVGELNLTDLLKRKGGFSRYEDELVDFLVNECNISRQKIKKHCRKGVFKDKREIDILLKDYGLGIEFNGDFFHSSLQPKYQDHQGRSRVHQQKSLDAQAAGVFLFQIFEYEWKNPLKKELIKDRLKNLLKVCQRKIGARKCNVVTLTKEEKKAFLSENHIQGNDHSSIALGLKFEDRLVACMSFVKPKNKKYNWELSRFCCLRGCVVQGGASRLLNYFIRHYSHNGERIVSYNDITKTKGDLYKQLGFSFVSVNPPNYIWVNFHTGDVKTRYQTQEKQEVRNMTTLGYARICDCGTRTWVFTVGERKERT